MPAMYALVLVSYVLAAEQTLCQHMLHHSALLMYDSTDDQSCSAENNVLVKVQEQSAAQRTATARTMDC